MGEASPAFRVEIVRIPGEAVFAVDEVAWHDNSPRYAEPKNSSWPTAA